MTGSEGVEALSPRDRRKPIRQRHAAGTGAAEARQILQAKRKIKLEILLEPVLLGIVSTL